MRDKGERRGGDGDGDGDGVHAGCECCVHGVVVEIVTV
jgi:hypothetical protein